MHSIDNGFMLSFNRACLWSDAIGKNPLCTDLYLSIWTDMDLFQQCCRFIHHYMYLTNAPPCHRLLDEMTWCNSMWLETSDRSKQGKEIRVALYCLCVEVTLPKRHWLSSAIAKFYKLSVSSYRTPRGTSDLVYAVLLQLLFIGLVWV